MKQFFEKHKWLFIIVIISFLVRIFIAFAPIEWILKKAIVPDDAFYYFTIAKNIVGGFGVTFDRISPTNGFHPLWLFVILPIFLLIQSKIWAVHAVLALNAVIGVVAVVVFYKILSELKINSKIKLIIVSFYAFSPAILLSSGGTMNGMETSLNVLFIFIYVLYYLIILRELNENKQIRYRKFIFFGLISGLLFLARTDNIVLIFITWLFLFYILARQLRWKFFLRIIIGTVFSFFIVIGPWLAWSYVNFGDIVQVSGKAIPFVTYNFINAERWNILNFIGQYLKNFADLIMYLSGLLVRSKLSFEFLSAFFIILGIIVSLSWIISKIGIHSESKKFVKENLFIISPLFITVLVFLLVQTARVIYFRPWYYFSVLPITFILIALLSEFFIRAIYYPGNEALINRFLIMSKTAGIVFLLLLSVSLLQFLLFNILGSEDLNKYIMAQNLNRLAPQGSRIGAWNAGIFGYFFENGELINLDGVVNNQVYRYIKNHDIRTYAEKVGIDYLVDGEASLNTEYWGGDAPIKKIEIIDKVVFGKTNLLFGKLLSY